MGDGSGSVFGWSTDGELERLAGKRPKQFRRPSELVPRWSDPYRPAIVGGIPLPVLREACCAGLRLPDLLRARDIDETGVAMVVDRYVHSPGCQEAKRAFLANLDRAQPFLIRVVTEEGMEQGPACAAAQAALRRLEHGRFPEVIPFLRLAAESPRRVHRSFAAVGLAAFGRRSLHSRVECLLDDRERCVRGEARRGLKLAAAAGRVQPALARALWRRFSGDLRLHRSRFAAELLAELNLKRFVAEADMDLLLRPEHPASRTVFRLIEQGGVRVDEGVLLRGATLPVSNRFVGRKHLAESLPYLCLMAEQRHPSTAEVADKLLANRALGRTDAEIVWRSKLRAAGLRDRFEAAEHLVRKFDGVGRDFPRVLKAAVLAKELARFQQVGGFEAYFKSHFSNDCRAAVEALRCLGLPGHALMLEWACRELGPTGPSRDPYYRCLQMQRLSADARKEIEACSAQWKDMGWLVVEAMAQQWQARGGAEARGDRGGGSRVGVAGRHRYR